MTEHSNKDLLVSKPERSMILVKARVTALRRKARNTRALALVGFTSLSFPLFGLSWFVFGVAKSSSWISPVFTCLMVVVMFVAGLTMVRVSIRRAMVFDREASAIVRGLSEPTLSASAPLNLSNVPASTTSAGITRRVWGTRFKRLVNIGLITLSGLLLILGACAVLTCIFITISDWYLDAPKLNSNFIPLSFGAGLIGVGVGFVGCLNMLKSEQRLLQTQESLVEIGTHLAGADDQPGSLQLSGSLVEGGQLSLEHQGGDLTQTPLSGTHEELV